ncbi:MAG TPA: decarboxylating 6-phosphogluconate dehydrogenase [Flavitalea sp.]|nr:decarboxylating 6-phosphogluconate dehydrogenase [Flavitalea sp.]
MQLAIVGLGKMGYNLALNLKENKFEVVAYDIASETRKKLAAEGVRTVDSLPELAKGFTGKKLVWLMVPSGKIVDDTIDQLKPLLSKGDIIIDGGNSHYKDSIRRQQSLEASGIGFLDCGTSGGVSGALEGVCAMIGGKKEVFDYCEPVFKSIAVPDGYLYCGEPGSGHYTKMVHNGIEYGMMQSIAEGFELMQESGYSFNFAAVAKMWNHGSVIRGWLMELMENAFSKDAELDSIKGIMHSSGEGKWMLETALEKELATPVIALSLLMRYRSLKTDTFSGKVVAALRNEFGGHAVEKK